MDEKKETGQSFRDFLDSFSYGSRNDLNFKFLSHLSEDQAGDFFEELLKGIGRVFDDGDWERIKRLVIDAQARGYSGPAKFTYSSGPFHKPAGPIQSSTVALLTSSGHYAEGDDPTPFGIENISQEDAVDRIGDFLKEEPVLSSIPKSTPSDQLRVAHGGYDVNGALADPNVAFPLDVMNVLEQKGVINRLADSAYSFVGACSQIRLKKKNGPLWAAELKDLAVDTVLLVPV